MGDTPLSGDRITEERAFIKRYSEGLSSHKVEYPGDYTTPPGEKPRKIPVIQIPIADPPELMDVDEPAPQDSTITLTIKSLKPALTITVTPNLTDTISSLKSLIHSTNSSAPASDLQRLLLKGKALADNKLLKEYDLVDGSVVHLYLKPAATIPSIDTGTPPTMATSAQVVSPGPSVPFLSTSSRPKSTGSPAPPSLTISADVDDPSKPSVPQPLTITDAVAPPLGPQPQVSSASFHNTISDPAFWQKIHALCTSEFEHEDDGDAVWETFLRSMKHRLSAGEAAKIRDVVGVSSMGGGA